MKKKKCSPVQISCCPMIRYSCNKALTPKAPNTPIIFAIFLGTNGENKFLAGKNPNSLKISLTDNCQRTDQNSRGLDAIHGSLNKCFVLNRNVIVQSFKPPYSEGVRRRDRTIIAL